MNWNVYTTWVTHLAIQGVIIAVVGTVLGIVFDLTAGRLACRIARRTVTTVDDEIVAASRPALKYTIIILSCWAGLQHSGIPDLALYAAKGVLGTLAIFVWLTGFFRLAETILHWLSLHRDRFHAVNNRTLPIFDTGVKAFILGVGVYFGFLTWAIDVTGWLASAGVLGVILGFGAKDSVADLFAGVFILAEAPYKQGDYLLLASGERGRVTKIGMRTTRLLTPDEVEIIIPNSQMATTQICNESGGPQEIERVNVSVSVAYGTDVDRLRDILLDVASKVPGVLQDDVLHRSSVHFEAMGDSGLVLLLRVWIARPELQLAVIDAMNSQIYKRLAVEGIEIPYPKRDVYLHKQG
jgi:small-conductance mechanosensitive channel